MTGQHNYAKNRQLPANTLIAKTDNYRETHVYRNR